MAACCLRILTLTDKLSALAEYYARVFVSLTALGCSSVLCVVIMCPLREVVRAECMRLEELHATQYSENISPIALGCSSVLCIVIMGPLREVVRAECMRPEELHATQYPEKISQIACTAWETKSEIYSHIQITCYLIPLTLHITSQHGPAIAWVTSQWLENVTSMPKTFTLMEAHRL
jgi:hypothetical protein